MAKIIITAGDLLLHAELYDTRSTPSSGWEITRDERHSASIRGGRTGRWNRTFLRKEPGRLPRIFSCPFIFIFVTICRIFFGLAACMNLTFRLSGDSPGLVHILIVGIRNSS